MILSNIRTYILGAIIILIGALITSTIILYSDNKELKNNLSIAISNEKAFINENTGLKGQNRAFQFTIEQLEYFNDSLMIKMNNVRKELKIKDGKLKQMQYLLAQSSKKDTIFYRDTIFKDATINMDTILGDKWYKLQLGLRYPNTIIVNPEFTTETNIVWSVDKETIKPPHKCWLIRLFQKKHNVLKVDVIENNPYSTVRKSRFIEVIK
jgi:hypothetical protein